MRGQEWRGTKWGSPIFGHGIGYRLMHRESEALLVVLEELKRRGITGPGLHDGLLVPSARATEAQRVMEDLADAITGYMLPVTAQATR